MKIFVARHGQTEWNKEHRVSGILEAELSAEGRRQAEELAMKLKQEQSVNRIEAILVSPLKRARDTAAPIEEALGIRAIVENDLHEMDFGEYDGTDWYNPEFHRIKNGIFSRFPGGESVADVAKRAYTLLDRIRREYSSNVLLVCHAALIGVIDTYFNSKTVEEFISFSTKNCQVIEYETESLSN